MYGVPFSDRSIASDKVISFSKLDKFWMLV